jgi:superfamily II DNA or RNA helicase
MKLRDYQIQIAQNADVRLTKFGIVYLAMEVRTGKTLTAFETARLYGAQSVLFLTKKKAIESDQFNRI